MSLVTLTTEELREIVAEAVRPLESKIHQLTVTVNSRLAPPVDTLTTAQAAKRANVGEKTIRTWIAMGYLSERRAGTGPRAEFRVLSDELEIMLSDGAESARRYRERMGRA